MRWFPMVEYANELVIKLLKQYDMLAKSLKYINDVSQKNDICNQMTKIISQVLDITNSIYEEKYRQIERRNVFLMDDEKNRLQELINLINERMVYVNNQISSNEELTGISFNVDYILGEDRLEEYKSSLKVIDRYKNNLKLESTLKDEIKNLDATIRKANGKINNNRNVNRQLEEKMIRVVENALNKLSLFELKDREKEIDLAYTELGFSLEKAKENAKIARKDFSKEIVSECDNILASTTLDYERYKEKKLILRLIYLYKQPVNGYDEILNKREEINNIMMNITDSELYSMIGKELNKEYSTIKLEGQDVATLKSLVEERDLKMQSLIQAKQENNSDSVKGLLSTLLENEKKREEELESKRRAEEAKKREEEKIIEQKKLEEIARRQKALEEERNKEIERRTKQLLDEKKNSLLVSNRDEKRKEAANNVKEVNRVNRTVSKKEVFPKRESVKAPYYNKNVKKEVIFDNKDDFFVRKTVNNKVSDEGIPVVKNNRVVESKKVNKESDKIFPDIPMNKEKDIFPNISDIKSSNSFFDENEFSDLSDYMDDNKKKSWF